MKDEVQFVLNIVRKNPGSAPESIRLCFAKAAP